MLTKDGFKDGLKLYHNAIKDSLNAEYSLPAATTTELGGVKIGNGISVFNGIISIPTATDSLDGLLSSSDKTKLDGIATGAEVNAITEIWVNGVRQTVTNKKVSLDLSAYAKETDVEAGALSYKGSIDSLASEQSALSLALDEEKILRENTDLDLQIAIDSEAKERESAVTELQSQITDLTSAVNSEPTLREEAVANLQTAIDTEVGARTSAVTELQTQVSELNSGIDSEILLREQAVTNLQTAIDGEISERLSAVKNLQSQVSELDSELDSELLIREQADLDLQAAIEDEAQARQSAVTELRAQMANAYTLPTASASVKGGIIVGEGLVMTGDTLSVDTSALAFALGSTSSTVNGAMWIVT